MTFGGAEWGPILLTQTMTLMEQLYSGIRVLDMRLVHIGNAFVLYHGSFYLHANFDDVLTVITKFLLDNKSEVNTCLVDPYFDDFKQLLGIRALRQHLQERAQCFTVGLIQKIHVPIPQIGK